jgi:hypothetical protein
MVDPSGLRMRVGIATVLAPASRSATNLKALGGSFSVPQFGP